MFVETRREGEAVLAPSNKKILMAARAKISKPENWCHGHQGKTRDGLSCAPWHPDAVQHCALGALSAVIGSYVHLTHPARVALQRCVPGPIGPWNNSHSYTQVIAAFDAAIAAAD